MILTTIWALRLTFRKCVDVCVTFKNDPNNHSRDTQNPKRIKFFSRGPIYSILFSNNSSTVTCYRLGARVAPLGEELGKAVGAVGELLPGGEPLTRQCLGAVGAGEALPVVGGATVGHTPTGDHLQITNRNVEKEV